MAFIMVVRKSPKCIRDDIAHDRESQQEYDDTRKDIQQVPDSHEILVPLKGALIRIISIFFDIF